VADVLINDDSITVRLSKLEKVEALHGDITVPRAAATRAAAVPDGMQEVHGSRLPGTGFPGVIMVGTYREHGKITFAVCHGRHPAVVIDLTGHELSRIVVTVDDPDRIVAQLSASSPS
jgi:hypothetical protein